jgi:glycosyltransferase involved in cell wall biosynthesis
VSIVVLNLNGRGHLDGCFSSLRDLDYDMGKVERILVDNGSSDDSIHLMNARFPEVRVIANQRNLGFSVGCNQGARAAQGGIVVFLNNDMRLDPGWLTPLVETVRSGEAACASSLVLSWDGKTVNFGGAGANFHGIGFQEGLDDPEIENYRPEPNLLFQLCHIYFCHNHPVTSGKCTSGKTYQPSDQFLPNDEFVEILKRWRALTDKLFVYEYYALGGWSRAEMLWPMVHTMRHDIPWYRDMGVRGFYSQVGPWTSAPLNYYVAAKLAWNADLDVDWLIGDFCQKFFEDAAEPMRDYLVGIEEAMIAGNQCISYGLPGGRARTAGPKIFSRAVRDKLRARLDDAQRRANTEMVRRRIEAIRGGFDRCEKSVLSMK